MYLGFNRGGDYVTANGLPRAPPTPATQDEAQELERKGLKLLGTLLDRNYTLTQKPPWSDSWLPVGLDFLALVAREPPPDDTPAAEDAVTAGAEGPTLASVGAAPAPAGAEGPTLASVGAALAPAAGPRYPRLADTPADAVVALGVAHGLSRGCGYAFPSRAL